MPRRFYAPQLQPHTRIRLDADEAHHLRDVLRASTGDEVAVFDGRGREAQAVVASISRREVLLDVGPVIARSREACGQLVLAVAPPRGGRDRIVAEKAVELGVTRLIWIATQRGVRQVRGGLVDRTRRAVIEAAKQCGRNHLMAVEARDLSALWKADDLPASRWVATPTAATAWPDAFRQVGAWCVAVGPEGGFAPEEQEQASECGWRPLSLGPRTLRTETAALAVAAAILVPLERSSPPPAP